MAANSKIEWTECTWNPVAGITNIRDQCLTASVPFFFKQWGGINKKVNGRLLDSQIWGEVPVGKL